MPTPAGAITAAESTRKPFSTKYLASAARTADPITAATDPGIALPSECTTVTVVTVSTAASTPSTVITIEGFDEGSGTWQTLLASVAITATGTSRLTVGANAPTTANVSQNTALPTRLRVRPVHGNANSHTYSVGIAFT